VRRNSPIVIFLLVSILMAAGCAHLATAPGGSEEALREKVRQEWDAKMNKSWGALYDLATDECKKSVDRDSFRYKTNVNVTGFSIKDIKMLKEGANALVQVNIDVKQMGFNFTFPSREVWLWQRGAWRLDIKPAAAGGAGSLPTQQ